MHKQYIDSLKVGDYVYPCYDAKSLRSTRCVIKDITSEGIIVEGPLWGYYKLITNSEVPPQNRYEYPTLITTFNKEGEAWTDYGQGDPTLMDLIEDYISEDEDGSPGGDFYQLQDVPTYINMGFYTTDAYKEWRKSIGLE